MTVADFGAFMAQVVRLLMIPIPIYGFTITFMGIICWSMFAGLVIWVIVRFLA